MPTRTRPGWRTAARPPRPTRRGAEGTMTRARGRGRHKPPPGRTEEYLYRATGQDALDEHQEQLDAADKAQGPPDAPVAPLAPDHGAGRERIIAPPRGTPRATTGLEEH